MKTNLYIFLLLIAAPFAGAELKMSFAEAPSMFGPEKGYTYHINGIVIRSGEVRYLREDGTWGENKLGCLGYASAVIHKIRYGEECLEHYDHTDHQYYCDEIAKRLGLPHVTNLAPNEVGNRKAIRHAIADGRLVGSQLYYFNVRHEESGHVGFVRVMSDVRLIQSHYSGLQGIDGLAPGSFEGWYTVQRIAILPWNYTRWGNRSKGALGFRLVV